MPSIHLALSKKLDKLADELVARLDATLENDPDTPLDELMPLVRDIKTLLVTSAYLEPIDVEEE